MIEKVKELIQDQRISDGWVSYNCPFCKGRSRPIFNVKLEVGFCLVHCFSTGCEAHGHRRFNLNVGQEDLRYVLENNTINSTGSSISNVKLHRIPDTFLQWLNKYHVGAELIEKYQLGYCVEHWEDGHLRFKDRLVIPLRDGYLARSITETPKWKNYTGQVMVCHKRYNTTDNYPEMDFKGKLLYIVEDPLSAIRLGEHCVTVPLLGTSLQSIHLNFASKFEKVGLWLDPDNAGYKGTMKIKGKLSPYTDTSIVQSDKEPKELTDFEIKETIK